MTLASILVYLFYTYLLLGLAFAVWFVSTGVNRLDENMRYSPKGVRLLLVPGSLLMWPLLLKKCLNGHSK